MEKELINKSGYPLEAGYTFLQELRLNWNSAIRGKLFSKHVFITFLFFIPIYFFLVPYLQFIEHREGVVLSDIILNQIAPRDVSNVIFRVVYSSAFFIFLYDLKSPWLLLRDVQILLLLQYMRNICLYLVPLAAPHGIVPLHDPILEFVAYDQKPMLQDLFFSGHTAAVVIFALVTRKKNYLFVGFLMISFLMAGLLSIQHCHYSIDILGGAFFGVLSYYLVKFLWLRLRLPFERNSSALT
jgi:PAP2 superfamily C-terminal